MALTALALIKARIWGNQPTEGDPHDTLLTTMITEATARIESKLGYPVEDVVYTLYYDGNDSTMIRLGRGPLVTMTRVDSIAYVDGGGGARSEVATLLAAYQYVPRGYASDGERHGYIERVDGGVFDCGLRNWKIQHTSGWATVPADIQALATWMVVAEFQAREAAGLLGQAIGSSGDTRTFFSPERYDEQIERCLRPYMSVL